jgi:hypothetical protein
VAVGTTGDGIGESLEEAAIKLSAREDYLKVIVEVFRAIQTERPTPLSGR